MRYHEVLAELMAAPPTQRQHYQSTFGANRWRLRQMTKIFSRASKATGVMVSLTIVKPECGYLWHRIWYREVLFTLSGTAANLQDYIRLAHRIDDAN